MKERSDMLASSEADKKDAIDARVRMVNQVRNEIERYVLHHPRIAELTSAELVYILSELAFRWSLQAVKAEREDS